MLLELYKYRTMIFLCYFLVLDLCIGFRLNISDYTCILGCDSSLELISFIARDRSIMLSWMAESWDK